MNATRRQAPAAPRAGSFTLLELVVSAAALAVLTAGLASAIVLSTKALPDNSVVWNASVESGDILERISSELMTATSVPVRESNTIEFTLPDRDNDGQEEVVRYAWSGTPGAPLMRTYNGVSEPLVPAVKQFGAAFVLSTFTRTGEATRTESGEILLSSYNSTTGLGEYTIQDTNWIGEWISLSLPADLVSWRPTRLQLQVRNDGALVNDVIDVELRAAAPSKKPTTTVLARLPLEESSLPTWLPYWTWRDFDFYGTAELTDSTICFVMTATDSRAGRVRTKTGLSLTTCARLESTNQGSGWSVSTSQTLLYYLWGVVTTQQPAPQQVVTQLRAVQLGLQVDGAPQTFQTSVQLLNAPETPG